MSKDRFQYYAHSFTMDPIALNKSAIEEVYFIAVLPQSEKIQNFRDQTDFVILYDTYLIELSY